jgi:hypothetical protein
MEIFCETYWTWILNNMQRRCSLAGARLELERPPELSLSTLFMAMALGK